MELFPVNFICCEDLEPNPDDIPNGVNVKVNYISSSAKIFLP